MLSNIRAIIYFYIIITFSSCDDPFSITSNDSISLEFSVDTLSFDTILADIHIPNKTFKVYNRSPHSVILDRVYIVNDISGYSIIVNGQNEDTVTDIRLFGGDSLLIVVQPIFPKLDRDSLFLVDALLIIESNNKFVDLNIIAWVEYPVIIDTRLISCNSVWESNRPYLLQDTTIVNYNCNLIIEGGTRLYMQPNATILVHGTLIVNGDSSNKVSIQGVRNDYPFNKMPGQWNGIVFSRESRNNSLNNVIIKNGKFGIYSIIMDLDTIPDITLYNIIIENMLLSGLETYGTDIYAVNTSINNCGNYTLGYFLSGHANFLHCNFVNTDLFKRESSVILNNLIEDIDILSDDNNVDREMKVRIYNSIVWSNYENELYYTENNRLDISISNSILRSTDLSFDNSHNILNQNPMFKFQDLEEKDLDIYSFLLDSLSPAINAGIDMKIQKDIFYSDRDSYPDIGVYEYVK